MNFKLEIINLKNENVISTSGCGSIYLGEYKHYSDTDDRFVNVYDFSTDNDSPIYSIDHNYPVSISPVSSSFPISLVDGQRYYYHADANGFFIEWCSAAGANHSDGASAKIAHGYVD